MENAIEIDLIHGTFILLDYFYVVYYIKTAKEKIF